MDVVRSLLKKIERFFDSQAFKDVFSHFVRKAYYDGLSDAERQLVSFKEFNAVPNERAIRFLERYGFDAVKDLTSDAKARLRKELVSAFLNKEGPEQIRERVMKVLNVSKARASAIAVTETNRAFNEGGFETARQSGLVLRKRVFNPKPVSRICKALVERDAIPLDSKFTFEGGEWLKPPFHVNCKSRLVYEVVE